jgi:hypothetical protein
MKIKISVPEIITLFKEIKKEPSKMFELIRTDVKEMVGNYISELLVYCSHLSRQFFYLSTSSLLFPFYYSTSL